MLTDFCGAWVVLVEGPVEFCPDDSDEFRYHFLLPLYYLSLLGYHFILPGYYFFLPLLISCRPLLRQPLFEYAEHCVRTGCGKLVRMTVYSGDYVGCREQWAVDRGVRWWLGHLGRDNYPAGLSV